MVYSLFVHFFILTSVAGSSGAAGNEKRGEKGKSEKEGEEKERGRKGLMSSLTLSSIHALREIEGEERKRVLPGKEGKKEGGGTEAVSSEASSRSFYFLLIGHVLLSP